MSSFDENSSNTDSDNGSDNEIDLAVADSIIRDDNSDEEDVLYEDFSWEEMNNYSGEREIYTANCGPRNGAENVTHIVSCFELFFDKTIIQHIVTETNRYAGSYIAARPSVSFAQSHVRAWEPVTENEMYTTLGLFLLMGIIQKPTIKSYFSKRRVISTPGFGDIISRDRFEHICKFLHFANNNSIEGMSPQNSKMWKIEPLLSHLNDKFKTFYLPDQDIFIDENLTLWKGCLSFQQFLPLKSSKFGIKTFELYESKTGYLWSFLIYTGKDIVIESSLITTDTSTTTAIVLKLVKPLLYKHHTIWMNNFYNSPDLAKLLKTRYFTDCVGTVKLNRKNVPEVVRRIKIKKGESIARHSGPVTVLKWSDKKIVTMVSTYHGEEKKTIHKRGKEILKPSCIIDYNYNMGGDLKDQLLHAYLVERKRVNKWYIKLFKRLLNVAVLNSFIIYKKTTQKNISHLTYRIELVENLFLKYASIKKENVLKRPVSDNLIPRLTERHFLTRVSTKTEKYKGQRRCVVCGKHGKRKTSVYHCRECNVGLCIDNCFELYHTKLNY